MKLLFAAATCCGVLALASGPDSFSIDQVLGASFSSDLKAAPMGKRIAWIVNERGLRNIYMADAPAWRPRRVTHYLADDGIEIGQLEWMPNGAALVYTRGGDLEMGRENPNPQSLLDRPDQAIWQVSAAGGFEPTKIGNGHSPAVSRLGSIAYIKGSEVWRDGKKWFDVRGRPAGLTWSPDGSALAFVNNRPDHSMIGVVSGNRVRYLSPSVDRDDSPVWSPDGTRIAFARIAADTKAFSFGPVREAEPWSILIADASSGEAKELFRAQKEPVVLSTRLSPSDSSFGWRTTGSCFPGNSAAGANCLRSR